MKIIIQKGKDKKDPDDTLYGLLLSYKKYNTYIKILVNEEKKRLVFVITDNPRNWRELENERYKEFRILKKVELNCTKLFIKYISPQYIENYFGENLGLKLPGRRVVVENNLDSGERPYYLIEAPINHLTNIAIFVKKLLLLSPQKKYEIIEKYYFKKI